MLALHHIVINLEPEAGILTWKRCQKRPGPDMEGTGLISKPEVRCRMFEFQASKDEAPRLPAGRDTSFDNDKRKSIF
jgi:hypothetical protein